MDTPDGFATVQKDLTSLEKQANVFMKLSNILHLGRNNTLHQYMLGAGHLENSFAGKDLRVLGNKMTVSQQQALVAKAANGILACMREVSLTFC